MFEGTWDTRNVVRLFSAVGALILFSVVVGAYTIQFTLNEAPCPLCLLIRLGMLAAGFGLMLNALYGPRAAHYGFTLLGAFFGAAVSLRQVALHIVPGTGSYGEPVLGFHLYTWAFAVFMCMILAVGVALFFQRQFEPAKGSAPKVVSALAVLALILGIALSAANVLTTAIECGVGACPDDPTRAL